MNCQSVIKDQLPYEETTKQEIPIAISVITGELGRTESTASIRDHLLEVE